ncbi:MAG: hypothetical protein DSY43_06470 [Gammaproteobacteria bacterium]|nr:MAG: hypothetical protein DSY43_06470 [Gammaproteobacteria bacterium]
MSYSNIHYGLIAGIPLKDFEKGAHPHLYIYVKNNDGDPFKIAVNIEDYDKSEVFFAHIKDLTADFLSHLATIKNGACNLQTTKESGALDYIRGGFVSKEQFSKASKEDLSNTIIKIIKPYINAQNGSRLIAYGSRFPGGIHDIHMNQGYPSQPETPYQDGALVLYDAINDKYEGLFFHFHIQVLAS